MKRKILYTLSTEQWKELLTARYTTQEVDKGTDKSIEKGIDRRIDRGVDKELDNDIDM